MRFNKWFLCFSLPVLFLFGCSAASDELEVETNEPVPVIPAVRSIVAEGRLEPVQYAELAFNVGGVVGQVYAAEGDPVEAGQVLARLEK
ncbi:MAG: efflux RND transporter periplasmic adaptor subunit, partial [Anaerolineales bacterium]|nr:efflux RND transporter periplasmic adaptor subunit [Anaerolineales bacterium]